MIVAYIIGVAGVGKSTTVKQLTANWEHRMTTDKPFAHRHYSTPYGRGIVIGKDVEPFGGTDTLSWTAINHAETFLNACASRNVQIIIAEGDRLSNARFFDTVRQHATLLLFKLEAPDAITEQRRTIRAEQHNTPKQNAQWVAGRQTKVNRLANNYDAITIDATQPTSTIVDAITKEINKWLSSDHVSTATN